jgi:hypothetical protein
MFQTRTNCIRGGGGVKIAAVSWCEESVCAVYRTRAVNVRKLKVE